MTRLRRPRLFAAVAALAVAAAPSAFAAPGLPLMPMPRSVEPGSAALRVSGPLAPSMTGCGAALVPAAVARFRTDLGALTGVAPAGAPVRLAIRCLARDAAPQSLDTREGYRLTVSPDGISVEADGDVGVIRALATVRQLVTRDAQGPVVTGVRVNDAPRFAWRGLMIDTARHFVTAATIKRQIDAMELAKLNVLHLHLSDNEGFRVESHAFPRLTATTDGQFYTQAEIREIVRYAAERGVRIVPEFDMPGHSMALLAAYPDLGVAPIDPKDPLAKPKSALDPASAKTYRFLERFLGEMASLFPDRQFHVGGDEVSDVAWKDSPAVAALMKREGLATKAEVEAWFHARVRRILAAHGKTTVGWDEMADSPLPENVIVQAWRSSNPIATATAAGHRVIVSAGFYINNLHAAERYYAVDLLDPMAYSTMSAEMLAAVRSNPVTAAQVSDGLVAHPVPPLTPAQEKLVIGGEGALWAEMVTDEMVDGRLWPRAFALGERFWSPATLRDPDDMYARLIPVTEQARALGLQDERLRARMIARLAPDDADVVARLIGRVAPAGMFVGHMEAMMPGGKPQFVALVDAASTDALPARRFRRVVTAYLAGDRSVASLLRAELKLWVDLEPAFAKVATGRPLLERAKPTAHDLAELGRLGLAALDVIEGGTALPPAQATAGQALLAKLRDYVAASASFETIAKMKQAPAALLILPAPDVGRLVQAATRAAGGDHQTEFRK